ncbi:hypothetical protein Q7P37_008931 [Cladosporium fusiforme]
MLSPFEFLDDVYRQVKLHPQRARSIYEKARDDILLNHRDAVDCAAALFDVATSFHKHLPLSAEWQVLNNVRLSSDSALPSNDEARHRRALLSLVAIWSGEIVRHYGWTDSSRTTVELLRQCALAFPDFEHQLVPLARYIMLHRHEESLFKGRVPSIGEHHSSSKANSAHSPLTVSDLQHLAFISKNGDDVPFVAYGVTMHPISAVSPDELERQRRWCGDDLGFEVRGKALLTLRPIQTHRFLLGYDRFGLLVPKRLALIPSKRRKMSAPAKSRPQDGPALSSSLHSQSKGAKAAKSHNGKYDVKRGAKKRTSDHGKKAARGRQVGSGSREKGHSLGKDAGGISSVDKQASWPSASCQDFERGSEARADSGHEWGGEAAGTESGSQPHIDDGDNPQGTEDGNSQGGCCVKRGQRSCLTEATNARCLANGSLRSQSIHDQPNTIGDKPSTRRATLDALDLATDTTTQRRYHHEVSLDLAIRQRHQDLVKAYTGHVREDPDDRVEQQVRRAWLRSTTQWAEIYVTPGSGLGHGESATESGADVVYTSSQEFLRLSRQGKVFPKPVVIKENFSDAGMFTLDEFASLLLDRYRQETLQVRALGHSTTESIDVSAFVQILRVGAAPERGSQNYGLNALDFHGITSCSPPAFTHLLRYRLLETLSEAAIKDGPGKRISRGGRPIPFDITGSLSFNILGLDGAFSPPHMDALTGTWVRNLCGIKLWMIVPIKEMSEADWRDFYEMGSQWEPNGKERLIVLEPDDVLLMPPGVRVIHAVHTPQSSLMEGGIIWDEMNILDTLSLLNDIHQHQRSTNESVPYQLYNIVAELEAMIRADQRRFASRSKDFIARFEAAIEALKQGGCDFFCEIPDQDKSTGVEYLSDGSSLANPHKPSCSLIKFNAKRLRILPGFATIHSHQLGWLNPSMEEATERVHEIGFAEGDSTFGDSPQISTTSLTPSVYDFDEEHGRRYHGFRRGKYMLPNDEIEQERMDTHGQGIRLVLDNKLWISPAQPTRVLDVGTGTGTWAIDMADQIPNAHVIGIDLSPIQPSYKPPNLEFQIMDADETWIGFEQHFDLIHTQCMNGVSIRSWEFFYHQAFTSLIPEGWVENQEVEFHFECDEANLPGDSPYVRWAELWNKGLQKFGMTSRCNPDHMKEQLEKAGFINVRYQCYRLPVGSWPLDEMQQKAGMLNLKSLLSGISGMSVKAFLNGLLWRREELEVLLMEARKELAGCPLKIYFPV